MGTLFNFKWSFVNLYCALFILAVSLKASYGQFCYPNPCRNGNCVSTAYGYQCSCYTGYTGTLCDQQQQLNPCSPNPCYNSGACSSNDGKTFRCTCAPNYSGVRCENTVSYVTLNPCQSQPCLNGGTCMVIPQSGINPPFACVCPSGLTGLRCETPNYNTNPTPSSNACNPNPCGNGGSCLPNSQPGYSSTYICLCRPGYSGSNCNQGTATTNNGCVSNSCLNGGTCVPGNSYSDFSCICPPAYTGTRCNLVYSVATTTPTPVNPCASYPCSNGGTCTQQYNNQGYMCTCPAAYTGQRCQQYLQPANACSSNPCGYGGSCLPNSQPGYTSSYICLCRPGYSGSTCNQVVMTTTSAPPNACLQYPCQNGGTCISQPNYSPGYSCVCPPAYTGQVCQQIYSAATTTSQVVYNACGNYPCQNGGTCISQPNYSPGYSCICPPAYTGQVCQQIYSAATTTSPIYNNACANYPCLNGGTCIASNQGYPSQGYICSCPPSFSGTRCERYQPYNTVVAKGGCYSNPCYSGATCIESSYGGFTCQCPAGYTGSLCDQKIYVDLCSTNSCYNGGTCQSQSQSSGQFSVFCICQPGYTGSRCQIQIIPPAVPTVPSVYPSNNCRCSNNGVCQSDGTCRCLTNFYGTQCEYSTNVVQTTTQNPCPSGLCGQGTCNISPLGGSSYCVCYPGWTGPRCNIRDYCQSVSNPCQNGGTCVNSANGYSCSCTTGAYGSNCQNSLKPVVIYPLPDNNQCSSLQCYNGGKCSVNATGGAVCQCPRGYIGLNCEQDICKQPLLFGSCLDSIQRYYYNSALKSCQVFQYTGCRGNENNFASLETCNSNCLGH